MRNLVLSGSTLNLSRKIRHPLKKTAFGNKVGWFSIMLSLRAYNALGLDAVQ